MALVLESLEALSSHLVSEESRNAASNVEHTGAVDLNTTVISGKSINLEVLRGNHIASNLVLVSFIESIVASG